jgi:hypothetical protein
MRGPPVDDRQYWQWDAAALRRTLPVQGAHAGLMSPGMRGLIS